MRHPVLAKDEVVRFYLTAGGLVRSSLCNRRLGLREVQVWGVQVWGVQVWGVQVWGSFASSAGGSPVKNTRMSSGWIGSGCG